MANRYWVGGAGTWDTTSTTHWSAASGGASGASVPTASDSVFFDQAGTYTVTCTGSLKCLDITVSAGTVTFATGTNPTFTISGSMSLVAGTVWPSTGQITFNSTTTGQTVTTNGTTISAGVIFSGIGGGWTLGSALTLGSSNSILVQAGTFDTSSTGNYSITAASLNISGSNVRTVNLNASTVTLSSGSSAINSGGLNLTFNSGTSQINLTSTNAQISNTGAGLTFYNVSFTSANLVLVSIASANTFNNLTIPGRINTGITLVNFNANQTINGTLTLNASTGPAYRTFLYSNTLGTQITLTCAAISSLADVDFRDINFSGVISLPVTGTRLGDCKGNNNITFPATKTVYWRGTGSSSWGSSGSGNWAATSGGTASAAQFPLAQDTAIFPAATYPASGSTVTVNDNFNIGTIDMSLRTTNTMTLATGTTTPAIYGNWINGTGITISGTGTMTFAGRASQQITSAGKSFTQPLTINSIGGTVQLQDNLTESTTVATTLTNGTLDLNGKTMTVGTSFATAAGTKNLTFNGGTLVCPAASVVAFNNAQPTGFTTTAGTGTGTISMTSTTAKSFVGGGSTYNCTLNQGGIGTLTVTGSNTFNDLTNTVYLTTVLFTGGTTNKFTSFNLTGILANLVTLGSTSATKANLQKTSTWYMGANSTDGGNNTGLTFSAGDGIDYLNVSYINGTVVSSYYGGGNFFNFF